MVRRLSSSTLTRAVPDAAPVANSGVAKTSAGPRAIAALGCASIVVAVLLASGVSVRELALFAIFEMAYALLPGLVLMRALAQRPGGLAITLSVAWPLGIAVEIAAFIASAATHQRWIFLLYPAAAAAGAAVLLWRERESLRRLLVPANAKAGEHATSNGMSSPGRRAASSILTTLREQLDWRIVATALLLTAACAALLDLELFGPSPLPRTIADVSYYPDLVFHISLAAEILHHWPLKEPALASLPLHYEIFANVDMAAVARAVKIELATVALRLQPSLLVGIIALQLYVLGAKVGGSRACGYATAGLGLLAGSINLSEANPSIFGGPVGVLGNTFSPSYYMGAIFFLALLIVLIPVLTDTRAPRAPSTGHWTVVLLLALAAGGAKASALPVLAGGVALFGALQLRSGRRQAAMAAGHLALLAVAFAATYLAIYRGGGRGQSLQPGDYLAYSAAAKPYHHALSSPLDLLATAAAALAVPCAVLLPLAGVALVAQRWWPRRGNRSPELLLLCMLVVSLVPFLLLGLPGFSQAYFLVYGFLSAVAVSAAGVVGFARKHKGFRRELVPAAAMLAGGLLAVVFGLVAEPSHAALVPGYALATLVISGSVWIARSRLRAVVAHATSPGLLNVGVVVAVALTLSDLPIHVLLPAAERLAQGLPATTTAGVGRRELTAGLYRGLVWLRTNSAPNEVLAVNNHDLEGRHGVGASRYFDYSAFAERRVFLESWDYTAQGARYLALKRSSTPFGRLLALNDAAVVQGSTPAMEALYRRYGVRYVVIDRLHGPEPPAPPPLTQPVYANSDVTIYRVRPRYRR